MIMMKDLCTFHQEKNSFKQSNKQTKGVQEVISAEVSKLNHAVMNKKQGDQMRFSLEERLEQRKWVHHIVSPIYYTKR